MTNGNLDSGHGNLLADPVVDHNMVKVGSLMWWHEVEIHLVYGAFALGASFGLMMAVLFGRKK